MNSPARSTRDTPLIAIVGATGTGKSALSLDLGTHLAATGRTAEIVNADAMQLYRGMDIGTAKLPQGQRRGIPHHLFDVLEPSDDASVARYQPAARETVLGILDRGATPILVGGSGLYVSSVLFEFEFPGTDAAVRAALERDLGERGPGELYARLKKLDPDAARSIGPHNGRRIVRALEVIELTGQPFGSGLPDGQKQWMPTIILALETPRVELVARLDSRVEAIWRAGLVDEVRTLRDAGSRFGTTAARAIGYAQAIAQLDGELGEREAIQQTAALTRKYARRQVSWFRRYRDAHRLDASDGVTAERLLDAAVGVVDAS